MRTLREDLRTFMIYRWTLLGMKRFEGESCTENQNTFDTPRIISQNRTVYEIMWPQIQYVHNRTDAFYVYGSVHRWSILITAQLDATQSSLFIILQVHSTCFGCQPHPSSVGWYPYAGWSLHKDTTPPQPYHTVTPTHIEPEQYNTWNKSTINRKLLKMDVLTFEKCWAVNSEIIKQVTSRWSIFIQ